jgi:hypothetical protein
MKRRQLLQAVGGSSSVALAGCLRSITARQPEATPPADRPDGFWRWVNIAEIEQPPAQYQVGFDLTVLRPWITAEDSAHIKATLTNEADTERRFNPIVLYSMASKNSGIRIYADADDPNPSHEPGCTGGNGKADGKVGHDGAQPPSVTLEAGESVETTGSIADDREVGGCFPPDVYRFPMTQSVQIGEGAEKQSYEFSFSLGVQGENE